jgi:tRNA/tmRNA/rRNA uracil-C5-methylase (TrmA/RlmC/RlmD family)
MTINLKIEKLIYGGLGAGFVDRLPVFVPMTVPGDEVECEIVRKHKGYAEGRAIKIVAASPNRVTPKCEYVGSCGGCQWQHLDYATQILWKELILEEQLTRIGKIREPNVLPTIPSPKIWNYRGRVKLHRDDQGRSGFYAMGTNELVEIEDCLIAGKDCLRSGDEDPVFTQVNPAQNENLKALVAGIVKELKASKVLELYCGNGNLTFPIAKAVDFVEAGDADKRAIGNAKATAQELAVKNVEFLGLSASAMLRAFLKAGKKADTVLVDPPRDGCKDILSDLVKIAPKNIIYVSCNPSTLARDIKTLSESGYKLRSSQPIDMFPQTFHIESVSVLI